MKLAQNWQAQQQFSSSQEEPQHFNIEKSDRSPKKGKFPTPSQSFPYDALSFQNTQKKKKKNKSGGKRKKKG